MKSVSVQYVLLICMIMAAVTAAQIDRILDRAGEVHAQVARSMHNSIFYPLVNFVGVYGSIAVFIWTLFRLTWWLNVVLFVGLSLGIGFLLAYVWRANPEALVMNAVRVAALFNVIAIICAGVLTYAFVQ